MKPASAGCPLMGAGMIIAIIGGIVLCGVNSRYWNDRSNKINQKWGPDRPFGQSALACGIFGVIRAAVSIVAIVMLLMGALVNLPRLVIIALAAVSAGLYLGEVIPGGICVQLCRDTAGDYIGSRHRYYEDSSYIAWIQEHNVLQSQYPGMGGVNQAISNLVPGYNMPSSWYWDSKTGKFRQWSSFYYAPYPCVIGFNSRVPMRNETTNLYDDCDDVNVVTVKCVGGWNQDKLNSAIKSQCESYNKYKQLEKERDDATSLEEWRRKDKELNEHQWSRKPSKIRYLAVANCILIVLQGASFILTAVGLGLYAAGGH